MTNDFAIITNTIRRDLELVEKSIRASLAQENIAQVVLVDQNSTKLDFSSDIMQDKNFKSVKSTAPAVSQARNQAPYPSVEWLIFCDDDGYMMEGYTKELKKQILANPEIEIFCGSIKRTDTFDFYSKRHAIGGDMKYFWNTKLLMGSNFAVNRKTFEKLGKFDENFGAGARFGSSEETDFAWNAYFNQVKMKYVPDLIVYHVPPFEGTLWTEMKKAFRYGCGKSAMIRKWVLKGRYLPILEFFEMLAVPIFRIVQFVILLKFKHTLIQAAVLLGRLVGVFKWN